MTVGSLADLGYTVDFNAAEPYELPNLLAIAEGGSLIATDDSLSGGMMLPTLPTVLPAESLQ
jgi:hypothetical protein